MITYFITVESFQINDLPFYILLGVISALISIYFNKVSFFIDEFFSRFKSRITRVIVGGGLLGTLIFLIPPLYGEGYETINNLLNGNINNIIDQSMMEGLLDHEFLLILLVFGLVVFKAFATSFTMGAGGVGGVFAPALFIGASTGYVFSRFVNVWGINFLSESNFVLVGMAGLMAGVLHAPLTAVFLIAEITGGYQLFIPLMLVSAISFLVTRQFMPYSFYTRELFKKGDLLTHNKDQAVLTLLNVNKLVESDFIKVHPKMSLRSLIKIVSTSQRNLFPVIDDQKMLIGIITLDDIRTFMFDDYLYDILVVAVLMSTPELTININDDMSEVMQKFHSTGAWNLPVVDNGIYLGFVSKSKLFSAYRKKLIEFTV